MGAAALLVSPSLGQSPPEPKFKSPAVFRTIPSGFAAPHGLAVADLVGQDGYPEVAVANADHSSVSIFANTGNWSQPIDGLVPLAGSPVSLNYSPYGLAAGDIDKDGDMDLVATSYFFPTVMIIKNNNGAFSVTQEINVGSNIKFLRNLVISDIDQDGRADIVAAGTTHQSQQQASQPRTVILWQEAGSTFTESVYDPGIDEGEGMDVAVGPIRGLIPGRLDVVLGIRFQPVPMFFVMLNDGSRQFNANPPQGFTALQNGVNTAGIALGTFRPVSNVDLVAAESDGFFAHTFLGNASTGSFTFDHAWDLGDADFSWGVSVGKINADTSRDIAVAVKSCDGQGCPGDGVVAVLVNDGNADFSNVYLFAVEPNGSPGPHFVEVADLNQDGFNDLVTSNLSTHNISVLINKAVVIYP